MVTVYFVSHAIRIMAELGLADHLATGPRTMAELAVASGTRAPTLARFQRTLAGLGLCATEKDGRVRLTSGGDLLRRDVPKSMRPFALAIAAPHIERAWDDLPEAIRTGKPTFPTVHGLSFRGYLSRHPDEGPFSTRR